MEIHGRDLERISELLFKLFCFTHAVVLDKEPHRTVTAIQVHIARTNLASKKYPMCASVRAGTESEIRIDERKEELCIEFLY